MFDISVSPFPSPAGMTFLDAGLCAGCAVIATALYLKQRKRYPYPPGPKGLPVIGNIFDMPSIEPWIAFRNWSCEIGSPIVCLNLMGTVMIVLNDLKASVDLYEKRGATYSIRPRFAMIGEACGLGSEVQQYRELQLSMARSLLMRLLDSPERFMHHVHHVTGSLMLDISYGIQTKPENDEFIETADKALRGVEACDNMSIIDLLPWIQHMPSWIPGMWWKKKVDVIKSQVLRMRDAPYEWITEQLKNGSAKPCIATDLISRFDNGAIDSPRPEDTIKSVAGTVYAGGSDTTVSVLNSLFLVMTLFPDVQRRAHEEIDRVVGSKRLPEFSDQENLPYITAIVKEILRWAPPFPLGIPHSSTTSDVYNGYYIPKGAMILSNSWAILRDPEAYTDPENFNPSRFLTPDGTGINPTVRDPEAVFGFGRRLCPGRFLAFESLWITTACVLAMFDIQRKVGDDGKLVPMPDKLYTLGIVSHPTPFSCSITPRSEASVKLV